MLEQEDNIFKLNWFSHFILHGCCRNAPSKQYGAILETSIHHNTTCLILCCQNNSDQPGHRHVTSGKTLRCLARAHWQLIHGVLWVAGRGLCGWSLFWQNQQRQFGEFWAWVCALGSFFIVAKSFSSSFRGCNEMDYSAGGAALSCL